MKKTKPLFRVLSLLLVLMLIVSITAPALAENTNTDSKLSWEKIDNADAGVSLPLKEAAESDGNAPQYADTDSVRVSIVLDSMSTITAGYSTYQIADNTSAMKYRSSLKAQQNAVARAISTVALGGKSLDVVWNLTLAANIISANVLYGEIEDIMDVKGVADVVIETRYEPCVSSVSGDDPAMATSGNMIGSYTAWANGYTGAGSRIAVIDTGLDTDHQSFSSSAYEYALKQNAEALGMSYEEYVASLDLITSAEVAEKWDKLNFASVFDGSSDNVYLSTKVPFGVNYVDKGLDVTHDRDNQGSHGSHVAGIAAANRFIPDGSEFVPALQSVATQGVAPDAQIIVMKVFGKGGGAYDSDYMAAIEDAIILGADSVNLSLGSDNAGASTDSTYQNILDSLADSDTVVVMSAGNSASWADHTQLGYLYSDGVYFDTVGSPGSFTNALTVASVDNDGSTGSYLAVGENTIFYSETNGPNAKIATIAGEHEFVYLDDIGTDEQFAAIADVVKGKVALCNRGTTSFYEKMDAAAAAGAIGLIVVNNQSGAISMALNDASSSIPCVSVLLSDGDIFKGAAKYNEAGNYYVGSLTVGSEVTNTVYNSDYYTMSSFSSFGVPGSLELKPEITAPGGSIYSVNGQPAGGKSYEVLSGTSMAAPQVAGMSVLVAQYIRESGLDEAAGLTVRQLTQSLLMSTAAPLIEEDSGSYYSVFRQGAGLANVSSAIASGSYIMMNADATKSYADGKIKAELGDDPQRTGEYCFSFELNNLTDKEKSFKLSAAFFTQNYFEYDTTGNGADKYTDTCTAPLSAAVSYTVDGKPVEAELGCEIAGCDFDGNGTVNVDDGQTLLDYVVGTAGKISAEDCADLDADGDIDSYDAYLFFQKFSTGVVVLPAGGSVTVSVAVAVMDASDFDDCGAYIEGYVFTDELTTSEGVLGDSHSIPVLAYYGAWDESSMFDVGSYLEYRYGLECRLPYMYAAAEDDAFNYNSYLLSVPGESGSYYFGGNPYVDDEVYMPERNAINGENGNRISKVSFTAVRNAAASRFTVSAGDEVYMDTELGAVDAAFYRENGGYWVNTDYAFNVNYTAAGVAEGTVLDIALTLAPEYYVDAEGSVDWDSLNEAASFGISAVVDNTAPEISKIELCHELNSDGSRIDLFASDNQYIAAVALYDFDGNRLGVFGSVADAEKGEECAYSFELEEVLDKYLIQVYDYALNCSSYKINLDGEEAAGEITMEISDTELELLRGSEYKLGVEVGPWGTPDESVTWTSDNEAAATVNAAGVVTAVDKGSAVITAASNADPTKSVSCNVTVFTVPITLTGVLQDAQGNPAAFSWNLETEDTWTAVADIEPGINSFAYDWLWSYAYDEEVPDSETFELGYVMNGDGFMYALDMNTYETVDVSEESTVFGAPMNDMEFPFNYNNENDADMILGIYGGYLLYSDDPVANDFGNGWNLSGYLSKDTGADAFTAMAWGGTNEDGADIIYIMDNANVLWSIYFDGSDDIDLGFAKTDLDLDWPTYDERQFCSMILGDDGNLYLSYFTGDTNEIYQLVYNDETEIFESRLLGSVGDDVWPCALSFAAENEDELPPHPVSIELPKAAEVKSTAAAKNLKSEAFEPSTLEAVKGGLNSVSEISEVPAAALSKQPAAGIQSTPSVSDKEEFVYVDVTASDAEGKGIATTNGIIEVSCNGDSLELVSIEGCTDYFSVNGSTFGYVDLDGIAADAAVAKLTFKVISGADVGVSIKTVEVNSRKVGYVEEINTAEFFKHENTVLVGAAEPTCTAQGYTGDIYCEDCGILLKTGEAIPVIAHEYDEWTSVKAPGCKTPGLEQCKCSKCGGIAIRVVPPAGHIADPFNDISTSAYHDGIIQAAEKGIIAGYADGSFKPTAQVTRGQFVTMLWRAANKPEAGEAAGFKDVAKSSPFYEAIMWANSEGIAAGFSATEFRPGQTITRAQMAAFIYRYLKNVAEFDFESVEHCDKYFADCDGINASFAEAIGAVFDLGIMYGVGDGTNFAPHMTANRGMAATVLVRMLGLAYTIPVVAYDE